MKASQIVGAIMIIAEIVGGDLDQVQVQRLDDTEIKINAVGDNGDLKLYEQALSPYAFNQLINLCCWDDDFKAWTIFL